MSEEKIKIALITPSTDTPYDSLIVECKSGTWRELLEAVEREIDTQFSCLDENGQLWSDLHLKIEFSEVTREWLDMRTDN